MTDALWLIVQLCGVVLMFMGAVQVSNHVRLWNWRRKNGRRQW